MKKLAFRRFGQALHIVHGLFYGGIVYRGSSAQAASGEERELRCYCIAFGICFCERKVAYGCARREILNASLYRVFVGGMIERTF